MDSLENILLNLQKKFPEIDTKKVISPILGEYLEAFQEFGVDSPKTKQIIEKLQQMHPEIADQLIDAIAVTISIDDALKHDTLFREKVGMDSKERKGVVKRRQAELMKQAKKDCLDSIKTTDNQ